MAQPKTQPKTRRSVTQQDIAHKLGISGAAVSMALNGTGTLSKKNREKILETAEAMGYRPDPLLSALAHRRGKASKHDFRGVIALLHGDRGQDTSSYQPLLESVASELGYRIESLHVETTGDYPRLLRRLYQQGCQGILCLACPWDDTCPALPWHHFSIVEVRECYWNPPINRVRSGIFKKWNQLYEIAQDRGYHCPAQLVFVQEKTLRHWEDRTRVAAANLVTQLLTPEYCPPPLILPWSTSHDDRAEALRHVLRKTHPHCDYLISTDASGRNLLQQIGISVPDDMGVLCSIGSETSPCSGMKNIRDDIARSALRFLDNEIRHSLRGIPEHPVELMVTSSFVDQGTLPIRPAG